MSTSARSGAPSGDAPRPGTAPADLQVGRIRLNPYLLGYVMGPAALVVILLLERFRMIAQQPLWLWLAVFVTIPSLSIALEVWYRRRPCRLRLHARVAWHAATVTAVIYLSGWGPVLVMAFAFVALENVSHDGSKAWRVTALWSVAGITVGQIAIWMQWAPSFLSTTHAEALGLMGAFVLLFVIRMAGATMEQKERAERSMRTSEERFRSLVQHSSDTTLVVAGDGAITYASPATATLVGLPPEAVVGMQATDVVHPEDRERRRAAVLRPVAVRRRDRAGRVPDPAHGRHDPRSRGRPERPAGPAVGGRFRRQPPRRDRAQGGRRTNSRTRRCTTR